VFKSTYLFGAFSPLDGSRFLLEMPFCNTQSFQVFINEFSAHKPEEFKIMVLDNGAFHKAKSLRIPDNMALVFIPPYSPELNPAEKVWAFLKRNFTNRLFKNLEMVSEFISTEIKKLSTDNIIKMCRFEYIKPSPFWTI
ncbi:MAG: transposase, partial [Bacteroidia bacterium]|nr:transposase [Bacteroidia bacterium]